MITLKNNKQTISDRVKARIIIRSRVAIHALQINVYYKRL